MLSFAVAPQPPRLAMLGTPDPCLPACLPGCCLRRGELSLVDWGVSNATLEEGAPFLMSCKRRHFDVMRASACACPAAGPQQIANNPPSAGGPARLADC